jgi:hypothetical protein
MSVGHRAEVPVNWEAMGAIGDFVGGLAVVASLIYLAIQVRHSARVTQENTREQRAIARETVLDTFSRWRQFVSDPQLSSIYRRGCEDLSSLDEDEKFRFGLVAEEFFLANERLLARAREGSTEIPGFLAVQAAARLLKQAGARQWWDQHAALFSPQFREAVLHVSRAEPPTDPQGSSPVR